VLCLRHGLVNHVGDRALVSEKVRSRSFARVEGAVVLAAQLLSGCASPAPRAPVTVPEATGSPHRVVEDQPFRPPSLTREVQWLETEEEKEGGEGLDERAVQVEEIETQVSLDGTAAAAEPSTLAIGYGGRRGVSGAEPQGQRASELVGLEVVERGLLGVDVILVGDGAFSWRAFRLPDPERLVVDLEGVLHRAGPDDSHSAHAPLRLVRSAQFQPEPTPVTRIVLDLDHPAQVAILAGAQRLIVRVR